MATIGHLDLSKFRQLSTALFLVIFYNNDVSLQLLHELKFPLGIYQKTNIYESFLKDKFIRVSGWEETCLPAFEYLITHKSGISAGVGLQWHDISYYKRKQGEFFPEYQYDLIFHNFWYWKLGYVAKYKSTSFESSIRLTKMAYENGVSFSCNKFSPWQVGYDNADFNKYNAGIELGVTQKIYKGFIINVSCQYYLPQALTQDNCLEKLPDNFNLFQTSLRLGYRFESNGWKVKVW